MPGTDDTRLIGTRYSLSPQLEVGCRGLHTTTGLTDHLVHYLLID